MIEKNEQGLWLATGPGDEQQFTLEQVIHNAKLAAAGIQFETEDDELMKPPFVIFTHPGDSAPCWVEQQYFHPTPGKIIHGYVLDERTFVTSWIGMAPAEDAVPCE